MTSLDLDQKISIRQISKTDNGGLSVGLYFSRGLYTLALAGALLPMACAQAGITARVSVDSTGVQADGRSYFTSANADGSISADGRFVVFVSDATNLVAGDTNGTADIFLHDRQTGITSRESVNTAGEQANSYSYGHTISADGRFVAFESTASNLVADDTNGFWDVFVRNRQTGTTTRISVNNNGGQGNSWSARPSLSMDGRFVAFEASASNLVADDTNGVVDIFVRDRLTGTTSRVNVDSTGHQANEHSETFEGPVISGDGRYVDFDSLASNLVAGDTNFTHDIFVHDRQTGVTTRVSVNSDGGQANSRSSAPSISADGRFVAFESLASNLVADDTNNQTDIFVHDRQTGVTSRVSVNSDRGQANDASVVPSISADGRFVSFESLATNLVAGDTNGQRDIFVHDRQTGLTRRINLNSADGQANGISFYAAISADGHTVAFMSDASNLVVNDTNSASDIFVHQLPCDSDVDCDGVADSEDNCIDVPNGPSLPDAGGRSQRDTNGDGFGNVCDADLNNDGRVTAVDYQILRSRMNTADADADLDGDGLVTPADYRILRNFLNKAPGPSALAH